MSPKTTPSAAKLKPAAPIAEAGLRFSAEILITRISMDPASSPTPVLDLGSTYDQPTVDKDDLCRRIGTFQSIVHQAHLVGGRPIRSYLVLGQKLSLFSIALASLFRSSLVARRPCRVGHFALSELNIVVIYDLDTIAPRVTEIRKPPSNVVASASLRARRATSL